MNGFELPLTNTSLLGYHMLVTFVELTSYHLSGERRYHRNCFKCLHCNVIINPKIDSFCYAKVPSSTSLTSSLNANINDISSLNVNNGSATLEGSREVVVEDEEHPFHRECFASYFGWICVVCEKPLPMVTKFDNDNSSDNDTSGANANNNNTMVNQSAAAVDGREAKGKSTKVEFLKHPFFDNERMCPHHAATPNRTTSLQQQNNPYEQQVNESNSNNSEHSSSGYRDSGLTTTSEEVIGEIRRCAGCHRFEPLFASPTKHFIDVGDSNTGRCVCLACCRTVVTSNDDAVPLWDKVIDFFEGPLGLITSEESFNSSSNSSGVVGVTRQDLKRIPVLVVGMEALNDNTQKNGSKHYGSHQIMTRGLCLSEHNTTKSSSKSGQRRSSIGKNGGVGVTAILILSGLPSDLTASILAHEATHAWIKLHPNFPFTDPLPLRVEEGLCQLVAHLFLNDGLDPIEHNLTSDTNATFENEDESIPSDEKLRQYFQFCIETDESVYGEGFRLAARAYAKMGMQELLYYVALNHDFPPL